MAWKRWCGDSPAGGPRKWPTPTGSRQCLRAGSRRRHRRTGATVSTRRRGLRSEDGTLALRTPRQPGLRTPASSRARPPARVRTGAGGWSRRAPAIRWPNDWLLREPRSRRRLESPRSTVAARWLPRAAQCPGHRQRADVRLQHVPVIVCGGRRGRRRRARGLRAPGHAVRAQSVARRSAQSMSIDAGSSINSFTRTRNNTACCPSITR